MSGEEADKPAITTQNTAQSHLTLLHTLRGREGTIFSVAWSPDGRMLASSSNDNTIRLWDGQTGQLLRTLKGHQKTIYGVAWSPDGRMLASSSDDNTIRIWDGQTGEPLNTLMGHKSTVISVAWSPNGSMLASSSWDGTVHLWDGQTGESLNTLEGHEGLIYSMAWSPNGQMLASPVNATIRLWDGQTGQLLHTLEGHTAHIMCISFSSDGKLLASKSIDNTVRIWRTEPWEAVESLEEVSSKTLVFGVAFHPSAPMLATLGEKDTAIRIWDVDVAGLLRAAPIASSVHYTTAKIALVGDSAVGKSGLGYRIAEDRFQITESTHGQQFWVVDKLGQIRRDGTQCEAVLWILQDSPIFGRFMQCFWMMWTLLRSYLIPRVPIHSQVWITGSNNFHISNIYVTRYSSRHVPT